ncbi:MULTISPECIES: hypothetical protein [unclassified Butyricimonas]|uniref:hypothetical protein n=1 Tax=unclassified Butyricimonas TaxID=2637652 RepID=UPI000C087E11|nr:MULTISPECIES: hypothetical protein [unclassified Butyricimonas]
MMVLFAKSTCVYALVYMFVFWLSGINMLYWIRYGFAMSLVSGIIGVYFIRSLVKEDAIRGVRKYIFVFEWMYFYVILLIKIFLSFIVWVLWAYAVCDGIFYWHHFVLICSFVVVNFWNIYKVSFSKVDTAPCFSFKDRKDVRIIVENDDEIICYMPYRQIKNLITGKKLVC